MATIFLPLTWQVWLLHIAMMVFGAAAILFMESTGSYLRGSDDDIDSDSGGSDGGSGGQRLSMNGLLKSIYAAFIHFLWNGPKHDTRTVGGKLALFALSFHTLVIAASYTASLAGFLSTPSSVPIVVLSFESIQSSPLTSLTGKLCVLQSAQGLFSALEPEKLVGMDNYGPMYEQLYRGKCGSLVTGVNEYLVFAQGERAAFSVCANESDPLGFATCQNGGPTKVINLYQCTCPNNPRAEPSTCPDDCPYIDRYKNVVPSDQKGFDAWYNWALPVRQEYAEVISNAILASRLNNDLDTARKDQLLGTVTAKFNAEGAPSTLSSIITVESIVSVYIYTVSLVGLALLIHGFQVGLGRLSGGIPAGSGMDAEADAKLLGMDVVVQDEVRAAAVIPIGLQPSLKNVSLGTSELLLEGQDDSAGMHLDLLCQGHTAEWRQDPEVVQYTVATYICHPQRLAQIDKELDTKLNSLTRNSSPQNDATTKAIHSTGFLVKDEDLSAAASPSRASGPSKIKSGPDVTMFRRYDAHLWDKLSNDQIDASKELSARATQVRQSESLANASAPNIDLTAQPREARAFLLSQTISFSDSVDSTTVNNKAMEDDNVAHDDVGEDENQNLMAPIQNIISSVLCFAKEGSRQQK